jgi:hypothetical protein
VIWWSDYIFWLNVLSTGSVLIAYSDHRTYSVYKFWTYSDYILWLHILITYSKNLEKNKKIPGFFNTFPYGHSGQHNTMVRTDMSGRHDPLNRHCVMPGLGHQPVRCARMARDLNVLGRGPFKKAWSRLGSSPTWFLGLVIDKARQISNQKWKKRW